MKRIANWAGSIVAVVATAGLGTAATRPDEAWYQRLDKPSWQPPKIAFPIAWTALYADIAAISALTLDRLEAGGRTEEATAFRRALAANLTLNAGWSAVFFGARRIHLAVPVAALLAASSADLARRAGRADPAFGLALAPYAGWTGFATALNAAIARRNPR